jgi:hypothetical protein
MLKGHALPQEMPSPKLLSVQAHAAATLPSENNVV